MSTISTAKYYRTIMLPMVSKMNSSEDIFTFNYGSHFFSNNRSRKPSLPPPELLRTEYSSQLSKSSRNKSLSEKTFSTKHSAENTMIFRIKIKTLRKKSTIHYPTPSRKTLRSMHPHYVRIIELEPRGRNLNLLLRKQF